MTEAFDSDGNIILIEKLDGRGGMHAHINGQDVDATLEDLTMAPSGSMDVHMHIQAMTSEEEDVQPFGA